MTQRKTIDARSIDDDLATALARAKGAIPLRVHSVFHHALNLETDAGRLITLVARPRGAINGPDTITVPSVGSRTSPGQCGIVTQTELQLPLVAVDLRTAERWQQPQPQERVPLESYQDDRSAPLETLQRVLDAYLISLRTRLRTRVDRAALEVVTAAIETLSGHIVAPGDDRSHLAALETLVGVGPGLTPAGDDALLGLLAVLSRTNAWADTQPRMRDALQRLLPRTTRISRAMLHHGCGGRFAAPLAGLIANIGSHPHRALEDARSIAALGHTTGIAMLEGVRAMIGALRIQHPS